MKIESSMKLYALAGKHRRLLANVGLGAGNMVEPISRNEVPSLKKRIKVPLDEEIQRSEEDLMPDKAKERKVAQYRRFGKMGGLQTW